MSKIKELFEQLQEAESINQFNDSDYQYEIWIEKQREREEREFFDYFERELSNDY